MQQTSSRPVTKADRDVDHYDAPHLATNPANYQALSPLSFLPRTASIYPDRLSVIDGDRRFTWSETYARCRQLASALKHAGIEPGDTVSVLAPNILAAFEATHGVPMAGAVLNALNVRLDAVAIAFILDHGEAKALLVDPEFSALARDVLAIIDRPILVIDIDDPAMPDAEQVGSITYEAFLSTGDPEAEWQMPADEWQAIALNYTSGTTGDPKGVVYHHRGAYLNAIGNSLTWPLPHFPIYLWTLPMFHCNGWCFPWGITMMAGTHVCLRRIEAGAIFDAFADHGITHLCGAPIIMSMMLNANDTQRRVFSQPVKMMTAASAPPAATLREMAQMGIEVTHVYGLTEVYGPATVCAWKPEWDDETIETQATIKARQGVAYPVLEGLAVLDPQTMAPVPADGNTMGEIMMRGNIVMKGYLKNPDTTEKSFEGGWFHTGDLAVCHPDGYVEIKDRSKDIIISGGENISTIEVEGVIYDHPAVLEAAVVARPDDRWGETPCAFVAVKPDSVLDEASLIAHCRERLASYKAPKTIIFGELPKTSTGKVQKYVLRERARELSD
ncbi:MAG: acyl-CoA synthetase [Pseudomonadota bacterium]